eukprot:m.94682 g.94682  ORF g.94682 m.94682 type:complete len:242 (+) comp16559_c0_seq1:76-801(+)
MFPRAALVGIALLGQCRTTDAEGFDPKRTRFIDQVGNNWVFRGNEPIINKSFAYTELVESMRMTATAAGKMLPTNFTIVDQTLLNPSELPDEITEKDFFKKNPDLGRYENWIIAGSLFGPPSVNASRLKYMAEHLDDWDLDKLPDRMKELRTTLETVTALPTVVYIHCEAGTDRTGEVSGAYYLKFLNYTMPQAVDVDNHIQNRDMSKYSLNGLRWYCYYLQYVEGRTNLDCPYTNNTVIA